MNNNQLIIILLIVLVLLYIVKFCSDKKDNFKKKVIEPFQINSNTIENTYIDISYLKEQSEIADDLKEITNLFDLIKTNINETYNKPNNNISINGSPISYKKFPVNIIYYFKNNENVYLAIFNDGALYKTKSLFMGNWEGPLDNSYPKNNNTYTFLRNINLTKAGNLLGIGYDGRIYIKKNEDDKLTNLEDKWTLWYKNDPEPTNEFKFILFNKNYNINEKDFDTNEEESYFVLTTSNELKLYSYADNILNDKNTTITSSNETIYRLYYDIDDNILFINNNKELKRTKENLNNIINKKTFTVDNIGSDIEKNPNILYDIIYDTDASLFGIGSFGDNIRLLKQENNSHYLYPFKLINNLVSENNKNVKLTNYDIANYKSGYSIKKINDPKKQIETLSDAYDHEKQKDTDKFKEFCNKRTNNQYVNLKMLNNYNNFQKKIEELKELKEKMIKVDESRQPLQDTPQKTV